MGRSAHPKSFWLFSLKKLFLILLICLAGGVAAYNLGRFLDREDSLEKVDLIVTLGGAYPARILYTGDLYAKGFGRKILLSRQRPFDGLDELLRRRIRLPLEHEINRNILIAFGVQPRDIAISAKELTSTRDEARYTLDYARKNGVKSVLVVTDKEHTRRACLLFRRNFGKEGRIFCRGTPYDSLNPEHWWWKRTDTKRILMETQKLVWSWLMEW